jgi:hypothetical protein
MAKKRRRNRSKKKRNPKRRKARRTNPAPARRHRRRNSSGRRRSSARRRNPSRRRRRNPTAFTGELMGAAALGIGAGAVGAAALSFLPFPTFEQAVLLGLGGVAGGAAIGASDPVMGMAFLTGCLAVAGAQVATEFASVLPPLPILQPAIAVPVAQPTEVVQVSGLNDGPFGRRGIRALNHPTAAPGFARHSWVPKHEGVQHHIRAVNSGEMIRRHFPIR